MSEFGDAFTGDTFPGDPPVDAWTTVFGHSAALETRQESATIKYIRPRISNQRTHIQIDLPCFLVDQI
jgi:hypothetical protein